MERLSTGLRNWLLGYGSMREAFEDCLIKAYTGPAPASADDQETGVLLLTLTKASGAVDTDRYNGGALSERSTHKSIQCTIQDEHEPGATIKLLIDYNGGGNVEYNFVNTEDAGATAYLVRDMVVRWLNHVCPFLKATAGDADDLFFYVRTSVAGDTLVITDNTGSNIVSVDDCGVAARSNCLYFAPPSAGSMSKASEVWSGEVQVSGVVGYFRIVQPEDDGSLDTTAIRAQGSAATSGAELGFSNTSLVDGDTHTVDTYSISLPAE